MPLTTMVWGNRETMIDGGNLLGDALPTKLVAIGKKGKSSHITSCFTVDVP